MQHYKKINNICGWAAFAVAAFTYISTIEPTASYWDCGEFLATTFKLEVGHPPGAPFFAMLGRIFMLFAGGNTEKVAIMVNVLSALASAFTILFLFWTITALAKKSVLGDKGTLDTPKLIAIMGAGLVGATAYTFSDSFWFSAVEGEVYATSSLFTAAVFWCILKWENASEEKHSTRWIVLIAFLMGLSIGVHLLNLLTIPAMCYVYYFKKFKSSRKGTIITGLVSLVILGLVQNVIIPLTIKLASYFDLFFVNSLGLPFNSGVVFYIIAIIGGIIWGLQYTKKKAMTHWNTAILCFAFILIGYTSYAAIIVRSLANPPMDENNPENVFSLVSYLNREQYGAWPLLYGQYYTAHVIESKNTGNLYSRGTNKYIVVGHKETPVYDPADCGFFPRMWNNEAPRIRAYKTWAGIKGEGKPTFYQNLKFFFAYQIGFQYGRYFMWNFAGRQCDEQGDGNINKGNWISGVNFIDAMRLGDRSRLPKSMTENKGYNRFYFLPLIMGLLGLIYHYNRNNKDAFVVFLLFLFTGIAIIVFLNPPPLQPRERDYAYSGSFYAFSIWIGFGVLWIIDLLQKKLPATAAGVIATVAGLLAAPTLMAKDGWDDHNRSYRYTARDMASNYLNSCAPNAILFTNGDNDTFPLWYAQEVEGIRTDIRVVNLSLLNTDWYIEQIKRKAYSSDAVPATLGNDKFIGDTRNYIPYYNETQTPDQPIDVRELIKFIGSEDAGAKVSMQGGETMNYYPSKIFRLPVDANTVLNNGTVSKNMASLIPPYIEWRLSRNYLMKNEIAILDMLAANSWKRPIYFAVTVGDDSYMGLEKYFQLEGLAYRIVPVKDTVQHQGGEVGRVQSDLTYSNIMDKFKWGGMNDPRVYLDENNLRMCMSLQLNFSRLSEQLLIEGKRDSAMKALDRCMEVMPEKQVPFGVITLRLIEMYYRIGLSETPNDGKDIELNIANKAINKANTMLHSMANKYEDNLEYYLSLSSKFQHLSTSDIQQDAAIFRELIRMARATHQNKIAGELESRYKQLESRLAATGVFE